ncbi:hypothetical protein ABFP09_04185 [Acinetobacter junii]
MALNEYVRLPHAEPYSLDREYPQRFVKLMMDFCQGDKSKVIPDRSSFFNLNPEDFTQLYKADIEEKERFSMAS